MNATLKKTLSEHARLAAVFSRFSALDSNGACCVATDILEAVEDGRFDADRLAAELAADCERMERGEE